MPRMCIPAKWVCCGETRDGKVLLNLPRNYGACSILLHKTNVYRMAWRLNPNREVDGGYQRSLGGNRLNRK